jgi:hypothetical protein
MVVFPSFSLVNLKFDGPKQVKDYWASEHTVKDVTEAFYLANELRKRDFDESTGFVFNKTKSAP